MTIAHSGRAEGGFRSEGAPGGTVHGRPLIPPPRGRPRVRTEGARRGGVRRRQEGGQGREPRAATQRGSREAAARPPPSQPPNGPQAAGAPAPDPRGRGDGSPSPRPREEPEHGPPPRPSRRLSKEPRGTSEPAPTRQDAAQIAPSEGGRARTGVIWGATPPMTRSTPVTPPLLPAQGRQRDGTRQSDPPPYRPPPAAQTGATAHRPPPPPSPPPGTRTPRTRPTGDAQPQARWGDGPPTPPRHAAPTGRAGQGDSVGPPHPHARAHSTWVADPNSPPSGRAVGGGGAPDPRNPSQQWKAPPPGTPFRHPHSAKPRRGEPGPDRPPPKHARRSKGPGQITRRGTDHVERPTSPQCRDRARCARHSTQGGRGADAAGARAHTHAKGTRGLPEGQPDRARGTHRPRGMAYQRARVSYTRTGRPATRSAGQAGREGGNGRDTTPGTGPNPPNRPRAPRAHGRGTAPTKAVVAHCATCQPLG